MKKLTVTFFLVLLVSCNHCYGQDYFNMSFEKEALYSPAKLELKLSYKKLIAAVRSIITELVYIGKTLVLRDGLFRQII